LLPPLYSPYSIPLTSLPSPSTKHANHFLDLSTLFTYNTKQVFLYITATYPADPTSPPDTPSSQAMIWDAILPHPLAPSHHNTYIYPSSSSTKKTSKSKKHVQPKVPGILKLDNQRPKYQITDPTGRLANRGNATLELHYNIQPWVGALTWGRPITTSPAAAKAASMVPSWDVFSRLISAYTQRTIPKGGRSESFKLPKLKEKAAAENLGTVKGGEANRGKPA